MVKTKRIISSLTALVLALCLCVGALGESTYELKFSFEHMPEWQDLPAEEGEPDPDWAAQNPLVKSTKQANIYEDRLDQYGTLTVAEVEGYEDVPYVSLREYMRYFYGNTVTYRMAEDKKTFTLNRNGVNAVMDLEQKTIHCDAWDWFLGKAENGGEPYGVMIDVEYIAMKDSPFMWSASGTDNYTVNLDYEGISLIVLDRDVLLPYLALQNCIGIHVRDKQRTFVYNGDDFYATMNGFTQRAAEEMTPYEKAFFSGRFCYLEKPSEVYARYNYAGVCLMMDHFFGHKQDMGFASFDAWAEEKGAKQLLLSADPFTYMYGLSMVVNTLLDSGHDGVVCSTNIFGTAIYPPLAERLAQLQAQRAEEAAKQAEEAGVTAEPTPEPTLEDLARAAGAGRGPETARMVYYQVMMNAIAPAEYRKDPQSAAFVPTLLFEDDTAFLFFPGFVENVYRDSFYVSLPTAEEASTSTFAWFYTAFAEIANHPEVQNVVVDLSVNGGGSVATLLQTLGFLSRDGEVEFTYLDTAGNNYKQQYYSVDTDLNGSFDNADGYGDKYDFYILTSPASYSSANAMPYYAQRYGMAKIIGMNPGGGDCAVHYMVDAYGLVCSQSSNFKLGSVEDGVFISDEKAVTVDIPLTELSQFYDRAGIVKLIHEYKAAH